MEKFDIVSELKALADLQTQLAKVSTANKVRSVGEKAKNKIKDIKKYIDDQAEMYGQNNEKSREIKGEYENQITEIRNNYESGIAKLEDSKQNIENLEIQAMGRMAELKKEINEGKKTEEYKKWKQTYDIYVKEAKEVGRTGNMTKYYEKMNEVRRMEKENPIYAKLVEQKQGKEYLEKANELLKENEKKQEALEKETKEEIEKAMEERTTALTEVKKQNVIQKFIGSLVNKIGGTRKFENKVIIPMKNNLKELKEETIPALAKSIKEKAGDIVEFGRNTRNSVVNVISNARNSKDNIINGIAQKIHQTNENTKNKIQDMQKDGPAIEM